MESKENGPSTLGNKRKHFLVKYYTSEFVLKYFFYLKSVDILGIYLELAIDSSHHKYSRKLQKINDKFKKITLTEILI